jgi:hypothetical protein
VVKKALNKSIYSFFLLCSTGLGLAFTPVYSQSSVLQSGEWFKVAIEKNGVYKINYNLLKKMGFSPSQTDPRKIKIFGNAGGMLPQANSSSRPYDLIENSIYVQGESDGVFNSGDYILFYAQGADQYSFDEGSGIFLYEKNIYADKNYYFITVGSANGKRIETATSPGNSFPVVSQFENFSYHELDQHSELKSGREWYGEKFDLTTELTLEFDLSDVVANSNVMVVSDVVTINATKASVGATTFNLSINGNAIGQQSIPAISYDEYGNKGLHALNTFSTNASAVSAPGRSKQEIKYQYIKGTGKPIGYLDHVLLQVTQELAVYNQQTIFRSKESLQNPVSTFEIAESTAQTTVWDISDPYEPILQPSDVNTGTLIFSAVTSTLKEFIAFSSAKSPELVGKVANQNLHGLTTPELVIVTYPDFKTEALRLAAHRTSVSGLSVAVVTTQEVYHEFSSGRQDISAIRDFVKSLNDKSPGTLKALLLFGKGSYDYKKRVIDNINLVPIYESRNSLHPLLTYSSDDYFTFLENSEGNWGEGPAINHTMDIGVGRIPVKNVSEAKNVVDKIIRYDTDSSVLGKWRKELVFVADDGDSNLHQNDANDLAKVVEQNHGEFNVKKIYLDKNPQVSKPSGEVSPETNKQIEDSFYHGALVINYTGHGGERLWAQEKIFDDLMIERLENQRLPLLVTATCEFGRQDDPVFISGAELCMLRENGGAISLVTTSRPVNAATNYLLNEAFYDAFFQKEDDQYLSLGEIFRRTKNNSMSGVSNRNFSLIGDPSLYLAMPKYTIRVTEITTSSGSTVLKALSIVTVKGEVVNSTNSIVSQFNGVLEATLFDKETSFVTLGNENSPFPYKQWYNALFRGKATIENGEFEFQFIVPKNIAYQVETGKLSLYAYDTLLDVEAAGFSQDFDIGSSEPTPSVDTTPPTLRVFMGDTTFINGGITNPNTTLVARLFDTNGINISGYGVGNSIIGLLDDGETFILNDFFEADLDDYTKGTISFPISNLLPGKHTIIVKAWDTHNNPVEAQVDFVVTDGTAISIETFGNYPNPFVTSTTLYFTHNRSGDDLEVSLVLYDNIGHLLQSYDFSVPNSSYQVDLIELDSTTDLLKKRPGGLYFARIMVRSLTNGSKNEQVTKLILSN